MQNIATLCMQMGSTTAPPHRQQVHSNMHRALSKLLLMCDDVTFVKHKVAVYLRVHQAVYEASIFCNLGSPLCPVEAAREHHYAIVKLRAGNVKTRQPLCGDHVHSSWQLMQRNVYSTCQPDIVHL